MMQFERPTPTRLVAFCTALVCGLACLPARAQQAHAVFLEPSAAITETLSDNVRLSPQKQADSITEMSATLRMGVRAGKMQGNLDYTLSGFVYGRDSSANTVQNTLNGVARGELVDNWLTLEASAQVGQQAISAFGPVGVGSGVGQSNRTEVRSLQVTPRIHGTLAGVAQYQAYVTKVWTSSSVDNGLGDANSTSAGASVSMQPGPSTQVTASASQQRSHHSVTRSTTTDSIDLSASYRITPDLRLSASAGMERTDLASADRIRHSVIRLGADWSPSPMFRFSMDGDRRFFGTGYRLSVEHRMPRSSLRLTSSRDVSDGAQQLMNTVVGAYDLFYSQFASVEPDPVKRDLLVRSFMQSNGLSPNAGIGMSFLTNSATLQRRTELSYAMQGVRSTLTLTAGLSTSSRLDATLGGLDDLADTDMVKQRSYGFTLGHRLTPATGLSLELMRQSSLGSGAHQSTSQWSARMSMTTSLGQRTSATLSARHVVGDSASSSYSENALIATLGMRF